MDGLTPLSGDGDAVRRAIEEASRLLDARAEAYRRYHREFRPEERDVLHDECRFAERRVGAFIAELKRAGLLGDGRPQQGTRVGRQKSQVSLTELGVDKEQSRKWQRWAAMTDDEFWALLEHERGPLKIVARRSSPAGRQIHKISLADISVSNRFRAIKPDAVEALAGSMQERGLIYPITVRPLEGGKFSLNTGHHRNEAACKLGWNKIDCIISKGLDAIEAELCEIDENLIRADLTPAEQAAHHARRKELYEEKHPETKKGAAGRGRKKSQIATSNEPAPAFVDDTAQKTGKHRSTVARAVKRGKDIPNVAELAGTALDEGAELDALAKLKKIAPERQANLIEKAKAGEKVSAKAEIQARKGRTPPAVTDAPHDVDQPSRLFQPALVPEPAPEPASQQPMSSDDDALVPATQGDVVSPTAPTEPAPRLDHNVIHRAAVRKSIRGLANIRDVDFGPVVDAMPIEQLLESRDERDEARRTFFAWSAALDAAFERAMLTEQPASAAAPPNPSAAAGGQARGDGRSAS